MERGKCVKMIGQSVPKMKRVVEMFQVEEPRRPLEQKTPWRKNGKMKSKAGSICLRHTYPQIPDQMINTQ